MTILPLIPSKLLRIAHADLQAAHLKPTVSIYMDSWVNTFAQSFDAPAICEACLAGAVMLNTLNLVPSRSNSYYPEDFPGNENQLTAINCFRVNHTDAAFHQLGILNDPPDDAPRIPKYDPDNHDAYMAALLALADHFEAHGW